MVNPITKEDLQQDKYLKVLERVNSKLFPEINIKQGLFNETWYCQKFTKQQVFRLVIKSLFTKQYILKTNISGNDILLFRPQRGLIKIVAFLYVGECVRLAGRFGRTL